MSATPTISHAETENVHDLGVFRAPRPGLWRDSRVLEPGWASPRLLGQDELLGRLRTSVLSGLIPGRHVAVSLSGPKGSGSSSAARWLVDTTQAQLARPGTKGTPLLLQVDASTCRTPSALVTALFRQIDPEIQARGASTEFLTTLLLRRIRTVGRPAIIWIDQVPAKPAELGRVLGGLADPARTLPEGSDGLPTLLVVASGASDPIPEEVEATRLTLPSVRGQLLHQVIIQRANLAFQAPPSPGAVAAIADLSVAHGWGLSMVGDLLREAGRRAEARGGRWLEAEDVALPATLPRHGANAEGFGQAILEVLRTAKGGLTAGELRRRVAEACTSSGMRAPTQARLWRHLVGLEKKGLVHRDIRLGGTGGSRTLVSLTQAA